MFSFKALYILIMILVIHTQRFCLCCINFITYIKIIAPIYVMKVKLLMGRTRKRIKGLNRFLESNREFPVFVY